MGASGGSSARGFADVGWTVLVGEPPVACAGVCQCSGRMRRMAAAARRAWVSSSDSSTMRRSRASAISRARRSAWGAVGVVSACGMRGPSVAGHRDAFARAPADGGGGTTRASAWGGLVQKSDVERGRTGGSGRLVRARRPGDGAGSGAATTLSGSGRKEVGVHEASHIRGCRCAPSPAIDDQPFGLRRDRGAGMRL